jgi:uncharacterized repeat protein (TIGR03803 family)
VNDDNFCTTTQAEKKGDSMKKFCISKMSCMIFIFCAATATASPAQILTTMHSFSGGDGVNPYAGLVQGTDGNFYGTASGGGANLEGTVFKITPGGMLTTLHSFCSQPGCTDGNFPQAGLVQATDGNFYGTTAYGGTNGNYGTVFKITPSGTLTTLYSFNGTDGAAPFAGLVQASDGNFYGTTDFGGANGDGTVFKITPSGTLTTLYTFCAQGGECTDGADPNGLVQASDGNFYGTTWSGGDNGYGTVFKITPSGTLTTLYPFCSQPGCTDGSHPTAGLVQAADGNFYGTTAFGGANDYGTVFKISGGALSILHSFQGYPNDGSDPFAALVQATDGNLYRTTTGGGANLYGTLFKITPNGTLTTLHSFQGYPNDGSDPSAALVQATDGNLYGTTTGGGANLHGTVFRLVTVRVCVVCPSVE